MSEYYRGLLSPETLSRIATLEGLKGQERNKWVDANIPDEPAPLISLATQKPIAARVEMRTRLPRIVELRAAGLPWRQIADQVGGTAMGCRKAYVRHMEGC